MSIPVYLFCGFLDGGKTTFIQETLGDPDFHTGEKTLLLLCEDGEVSYTPAAFAAGNVTILPVEQESELTSALLQGFVQKHSTDRVIIEYNGMWQMETLYNALPEDWEIFQIVTVADAGTFSSYLNNLRSLTVDKLRDPEVVLFNRVDENTDKLLLHRAVRMVNRAAQILHETKAGAIEPDEIVEPLPFDKNAADITLADTDFGLWYLDALQAPQCYIGKTLRFKAYVCQTPRVPEGSLIAGRFAMTCCADDISFYGVVCDAENAAAHAHRSWVDVVATVGVREHEIYEGEGPWLAATSITPAEPPEEELIYFLR